MTQEELKAYFKYDPLTGLFTWRIAPHSRVEIGSVAGSLSHGYVQLKVFGESILAHRAAFLYMTGKLPENKVDHKDLNRANNKWNNLREADDNQNSQNSPVKSTSLTGAKGVKLLPSGRYQARIKVNGKYKNLGVFDKIEEASNAYANAAEAQYGEFAQY